MNPERVNAAAQVILAAQRQGRHVAAGWAMALEAAGMLRLPAAADLLGDRTRELIEMEADRNRWKARAAEGYPGELSALRGTLRVIRTAVQHGGTPTVADIVAEHYADERAAYAAVEPTEKDTATAATSTPLTVYSASWQHEPASLGTYTTAAAAQARCEAAASESYPDTVYPDTVAILFDWVEDTDEHGTIWELVVQVDGGPERSADYIVTAVRVATSYDPETGL